MRTNPWVVVLLATALLVSCSEEEGRETRELDASAIRTADQLTILALDPSQMGEIGAEGYYHDWKIVDERPVPIERAGEIAGALEKAVEEGEEIGLGNACFNPRHVLRTVNGNDTIDYVICFECSAVEVCRGSRTLSKHLITSSAEPLLDSLLM